MDFIRLPVDRALGRLVRRESRERDDTSNAGGVDDRDGGGARLLVESVEELASREIGSLWSKYQCGH